MNFDVMQRCHPLINTKKILKNIPHQDEKQVKSFLVGSMALRICVETSLYENWLW